MTSLPAQPSLPPSSARPLSLSLSRALSWVLVVFTRANTCHACPRRQVRPALTNSSLPLDYGYPAILHNPWARRRSHPS